MTTFNTIDLLYFSGYIDGDGCFAISKNASKRSCRIDVCSTNPKVLFYFIESFGGGIRYAQKHTNPTHKPLHHYSIGGKSALAIAKAIEPYLIEKKTMCQLFCSYFAAPLGKERNKIIEELAKDRWEDDLVTIEDIARLKEIDKTIEPTDEDFAYLAGFIDAECNLGVQKYKAKDRPNFLYKTVLQLNNSKGKIFYWIKPRFGGSVYFIDRKSKDPSRKNQLYWKTTGKSLYPILTKILPFLKYKKPVCEKLIELYDISLPNGGDRQSTSFKEASMSTIRRKEEIVHQIHQLNHKGVVI